MSDEKNKRLMKKIFGYYPVFDPKTMKKIPPKTFDEKIDSRYHYLDDERRKLLKDLMSSMNKALEPAKKLEKMKKISVKRSAKGEEYDEVELLRIIEDSLYDYITNFNIPDVKLLLSKIPTIPLIDADVIDDEILNDDFSVKNMSVAKYEKLIQYLNKDQRDLLVIELDAMIIAYCECNGYLNN